MVAAALTECSQLQKIVCLLIKFNNIFKRKLYKLVLALLNNKELMTLY